MLVDVARQLFAKNGLDDTTMNDIAVASGKGRRTLYTYFKNKEEIYYAVIESELERMSDRMRVVAHKASDCETRLVNLIYTHLSLIKEAVSRNGNLRAQFFRDIWTVEKVRKNFDMVEVKLMKEIISEGVARGVFDVANISITVEILHYCAKGMEVPYIYGRVGEGMGVHMSRPIVRQIVHRAMSPMPTLVHEYNESLRAKV